MPKSIKCKPEAICPKIVFVMGRITKNGSLYLFVKYNVY